MFCQVKRYPAYPAPRDFRSYSTETSKPTIYHKYTQRGITPPPGGAVTPKKTPGTTTSLSQSSQPQSEDKQFTLKYHTQQHLRQMQYETQVLKQKEMERQREKEQREIAKQRIEHELQKTKEELEREDEFDHMYTATKPLQKHINASSTSHRGDSPSLTSDFTSDYSTNSSNTNTFDSKTSLRVPVGGYGSDYSSSTSPSLHRIHKGQSSAQPPYAGWSGKYFVLSSTSASPRLNKRTSHDDMDLYRHQLGSPRIASKTSYQATASGSSSQQNKDKSNNFLTVPESGRIRRSSGNQQKESIGRRGSLDSLIDHYDTQNNSLYDSDSEQEDLLASLTTTFDQKLKSLVEYPRSASGVKDATKVGETMSRAIPKQASHQNSAPSKNPDEFKNPSLHRVATPPKLDYTKPRITGQLKTRDDLQSNGSKQFSSDDPSPDGSNKTPHAKMYAQAVRKSGEKMFGSREKILNIHSKSSSSSSSQSDERAVTSSAKQRSGQRQTVSPPPQSQITGNRRHSRQVRRHTVGGTLDFEHMNALMAINSRQPSVTTAHKAGSDHSSGDSSVSRLSAWERLQPKTVVSRGGQTRLDTPPRDVSSWLRQQQRLRAVKSTPSLIDPDLTYDRENDRERVRHAQPDYLHYSGNTDSRNAPNTRLAKFGFYEFDSFSPSENRQKRRLSSQRSSDHPPSGGSERAGPVSPGLNTGNQLKTRTGGFTFESSI